MKVQTLTLTLTSGKILPLTHALNPKQGREKGNKGWEKGEEGWEKGEKGWEKSHFQKNETGKTRFVAGPTNDTGFYFPAGRRHYFVTVHLIGYMQMRHRSDEIP